MGGLAFGLLVFTLSPWLPQWEQLPRGLILSTATANLLYGAYSGQLAWRNDPSATELRILVYANAAWGILCLILAAKFWSEATWLGRAHLAGEGLFVAALAAIEHRVFFPKR